MKKVWERFGYVGENSYLCSVKENEKTNVKMVIKLHMYYGDGDITKSVMEVFLDGEEMPRMVCEAREAAYRDYTESFAGASQFCLPAGRWRMAVGHSPYSPMGLRVPRCPGHRQVFVGHRWSRQSFEGEILVGEPVMHFYTDEQGQEVEYPPKRRITNGEEVFNKLDALVYEAYGRLEEFWLEVDNEEISMAKDMSEC